MMLSERLKVIADLVNKNDIIADVGCDHAYLSIYLALNKLCKQIVATEVVDGPYNIALNNIKKYHVENDIKLYLTDGLTGVEEQINTIIIAGMGTSTIKHILNCYDLKNISKLIIQSNSEWSELRSFINSLGYYIEKEINTYENNKDYLTFLIKNINKNNTKDEIVAGKFNNDNHLFYTRRIAKLENIQQKIPNKDNNKYKELNDELEILRKYIS